MIYLLLVSILWAFSFGLIGNRLAGVDPTFVACVRLSLAALCFLPLLRLGRLPRRASVELIALGGLQFGLMYIAYIRSYQFVPSHLVALFTVLTPLYIVLAEDLLDQRIRGRFLLCALLAISGALVLRGTIPEGAFWRGFLLVQLANCSFGVGQVWFRRWRHRWPQVPDQKLMGLPYLGGVLVAGSALLVTADQLELASVTGSQWLVMLYLGVAASGIGFWLWNRGATRVSAGTLAAFNNAVIPLAMVVSLFGFGESRGMGLEEVGRLSLGAALIVCGILLGLSPAKVEPLRLPGSQGDRRSESPRAIRAPQVR